MSVSVSTNTTASHAKMAESIKMMLSQATEPALSGGAYGCHVANKII